MSNTRGGKIYPMHGKNHWSSEEIITNSDSKKRKKKGLDRTVKTLMLC